MEEGSKKTKRKKNRPSLFETFTKAWVTVLLIISIVDLQLSYLLAYIGRDEIAESLSVAVVTEIVGVIGIYMIRAFFDTYSEKKHSLSLSEMESSSESGEDYIEDEEEPEEKTTENDPSIVKDPEFDKKVDEMNDNLLYNEGTFKPSGDTEEVITEEDDDDDSVG